MADPSSPGEASPEVRRVARIVRKLRKRLQEHRKYMEPDETRTRVLLIDPMLCALGWDVLDPTRVRLEHRDNGNNGPTRNKMDYVLVSGGHALLAVVEAKRLGAWPDDSARRQASGYAVGLGVPYAFLSNGARWEGWEIVRGKKRRETILLGVNVASGAPEEVARKLMRMHCDRLGRPPSSGRRPHSRSVGRP